MKTSSTTAKTALAFGIAGTAGALLRGSGNGGGILGNLFGNNAGDASFVNSPMAVYQAQKMDAGQAAVTELSLINSWLMPMLKEIGDIKTQAAVTSAVTPLLIGIGDERGANALAREMDCVIKGKPMIVPEQMGERYRGSFNEILTRHSHYPRAFGWQEYGDCDGGCKHGHR